MTAHQLDRVAAPGSVTPPENPTRPGQPLLPFRAHLHPPRSHRLPGSSVTEIDVALGAARMHPDLPAVPIWGYALAGDRPTTPGPLLEARAGETAFVRFRNRLPASQFPLDPTKPAAQLPIATAVVDDPNDADSVQNYLTNEGGLAQDTSMAPIGWITTHLHGAHSRSDADGWPDNMAPTGGEQVCVYDNTYDNVDLGLNKVGSLLWYHDHAMNGTRFHVFAGLAGAYLLRDPREHHLDLPTSAKSGELALVIQDRNVDVVDGGLRLLHKTTPDTGEFFGPLTVVNGLLWPRVSLAPRTHRLRILNGSNARAYRLHLVSVVPGTDGAPASVTTHHDRVLVIGVDGGLLWRPAPLAVDAGLTLAPAERVDVLLDLDGLDDGAQLYLINSAPAPFGGDPVPDLSELWAAGDRAGRNPFPWVLRVDVDFSGSAHGAPPELFDRLAAAGAPTLNPKFRRLTHALTVPVPDAQPPEHLIEGHEHHVILLAETNPPGHLYAQEVVQDEGGRISLQLPGDAAPKAYRVEGWMDDDPTSSESRVAFYDRTALRPLLGQWQVFVFVNTTGDTHPMHIHQSNFQPLGAAAGLIDFVDAAGNNRYDPATRTTSTPITAPADLGRTYDDSEIHGWKDVIRVDPGNVVKVAIRFDVPGRYVYHCHVLEHEDTQMMRPFVVTVHAMTDGTNPMHM